MTMHQLIRQSLQQLKFCELLPYPLYSLDLAPSNYSMFVNLKNSLGGERFKCNEEAVSAVIGYLAEFYISLYQCCITKLLEKFISLSGNYVDK